jgi:prolycopene isomerase
MSNYDVIVIGSGIGGLTCGAFLAKHGKKVLIVEQHFKPGGAVTSFTRKGFHFDIPSVVSSMNLDNMYGRMMSELGVFDKLEFLKLERLYHLIYPDMTFDCYADAERHHAELGAMFPAERRGIDQYFSLMRSLTREVKDSYYAPGIFQFLQYPFRFPRIIRYAQTSFQDVVDRFFKDDRLKAIVSSGWEYLGTCPNRLSALYMLIMYYSYLYEGTYVVRGGFQKMADVFAEAFRGFGGELRCSSLVRRITIRHGRTAGIALDDGEEIAGRVVVSNADVTKTFIDLVGEENLPSRLFRRVKKTVMSASAIGAHLGVRMNIPETFKCGSVLYHAERNADASRWDTYLKNEIETDLKKKHFAFDVRSLADPSLAPEGCHSVYIWSVPIPSHYQNDWMKHDENAYRELKKRMQDNLVEAAEQVLPGLSNNILVSDFITPRTIERYILSTNGAVYDAACTPDQIGLNRMPSQTAIPGLYITGAKSFPGHGIVAAMQSGAYTADILLHQRLVGGRCNY